MINFHIQKKEEQAEQKPKQDKPEAKAGEQPKPVAPQAASDKPEAAKKKKKINRLTLKELEKEIEGAKEKMGGLRSQYAQQLLKRKEQLTLNKEPGPKEENDPTNT